MKKENLALSVLALTAAAFIAIPSIGSAYRGDPSIEGPNCTAERHEAMEKAFENNDYDAWKELMGDRGRVTQVITAENFSRFSEAHRLMEEGRIEEARQIRAELGLGLKNGVGRMMMGR